jgi:ubiquinone/menaquinone biosynthesis C-methylase UbiE
MNEILEFDDELSRVVEVFNQSSGAKRRRRKIAAALAPEPGESVLDVGCGPGHQAYELSSIVGPTGQITGVDPAESAIAIASSRCSGLSNARFRLGEAANLPFDDQEFDSVMSSQVFEYLNDVDSGLREMYRVLRPGGRVLIHDTDWGALLWHSSDSQRMAQVTKIWDKHLADPSLPRTLKTRLRECGFVDIAIEPIVQLETEYDPSSVSGVLTTFIAGYVVSQGFPESEAKDWEKDLQNQGEVDDYFFSSNEYIFVGRKPS